MLSISRAKVAFIVLALTLVMALSGHNTTQAATGGTVSQFSSDFTLTASATGVSSSIAFPDGNTSAQCFVQILPDPNNTQNPTTKSYGNCAGLSVTVTCGSIPFDKSTSPFASNGAAFNYSGSHIWTGMYDKGPSCTTVPGASATLSADVKGYAAGQNVVVWWNNDTQQQRSGCVSYLDAGTSAATQCITQNASGNNGAFYEATTQGTSGTAYETTGSLAGNVTLGGVFINVQSGGPAAPTATATVPPTATPVPSANTPAKFVQFGTDPTITSTASGVTTNIAFPDTSTTASCYIQITSKSGPQATTFGNCTGFGVNVTCSSFQFNNTPATDQHGGALVLNGTRTQAGAYDTGPSCTTIPGATLTYDITGLTAGTRFVEYWNNDGSASRNGCVSARQGSVSSFRACFTNSAAGNNGTFYEAVASGGTVTAFETQGQTGVAASGNVTAGGVFINVMGGTPLSAKLASPKAHHRAHHHAHHHALHHH